MQATIDSASSVHQAEVAVIVAELNRIKNEAKATLLRHQQEASTKIAKLEHQLVSQQHSHHEHDQQQSAALAQSRLELERSSSLAMDQRRATTKALDGLTSQINERDATIAQLQLQCTTMKQQCTSIANEAQRIATRANEWKIDYDQRLKQMKISHDLITSELQNQLEASQANEMVLTKVGI
jgi:chromosome segregation ATPase